MDRRRLSPDRARVARHAAALFRHWMRDDMAGLDEVMSQAVDYDNWEAQLHLVCALLDVGTQMTKAAAAGDLENYLDQVLAYAAFDEYVPEAADG